MKKIFGVVLAAVLLASCGSTKDTNKVSKNFRITIQSISNNEITLRCTTGCAWNTMSFDLPKYEAVGLDPYGLSNTVNTLAHVNDAYPDFKFTITRTDNGAELSSLRGTRWNKLSINCPSTCNQTINYDGMVR